MTATLEAGRSSICLVIVFMLDVYVVMLGDVLYLPPYWWHHVESLTESVGLNFWIEMSKDASQVVTLSPTQLVAIRRNVEKFIGTVIPPQQLGSFLQELVEGRFDLDHA